jgi:hypothetical protein
MVINKPCSYDDIDTHFNKIILQSSHLSNYNCNSQSDFHFKG